MDSAWSKKESHRIYNQVLLYKDFLIQQRKKLNHLRTRWRLEKGTHLLPDIDNYFGQIIKENHDVEEQINANITNYFFNFFDMYKLIPSENPEESLDILNWMELGEKYGKSKNKLLNGRLGSSIREKDYNPFYIEYKKQNNKEQDNRFNSITILNELKKFISSQYEIISLLEHCFNQRIQGAQIPVLDTKVTEFEKIGGTQIMFYAADSLVLDYLNNQDFVFEGSDIKKLWDGLTNFGYETDFGYNGKVIVAPSWSKYIHHKYWILFSHECGHLKLNSYLLQEEVNKAPKKNTPDKTLPYFSAILDDISEAISPLFDVSKNHQIAEEIFCDIYATFMAGIDYLQPLMNLHFSPSIEFNNVPLRIDICKHVILVYLGIDDKYLKNFIQMSNIDNTNDRLLANFEIVQEYRRNILRLKESINTLEIKDIPINEKKSGSKKWTYDKLLEANLLEYRDTMNKIIGIDYYRDIVQDFSRISKNFSKKAIIKNIKNLITYDFYSSLRVFKSDGKEILNFDNNIKEILLTLISFDIQENNSYQSAVDLCDEKYVLNMDIYIKFITNRRNNNHTGFRYLDPLIEPHLDYLIKILYNETISIHIKPRHLISMLARNERINFNTVIFALSHNKNTANRYG